MVSTPGGPDFQHGERIVLATRNDGKARELTALLGSLGAIFETLLDHPPVELPPEAGTSYLENAIAKARTVHRALGVAAIGDDSGLEVDALSGAPGLWSARYAGPGASDAENNRKLLAELRDQPADRRTGRFRCVLAMVRSTGEVIHAEGVCEGRLLDAPRGDRGFGYDPLFVPSGEGRTFAELSAEDKARHSHRARAARALLTALQARKSSG